LKEREREREKAEEERRRGRELASIHDFSTDSSVAYEQIAGMSWM
jgi:hypothetical protein